MPLTQKKRHKPLMLGYFEQIGLSSKALAKQCAVSHSQMYMARTRSVGMDNAEKISSGIGRILGLTSQEELELKAEIMGHPDNLVRTYFGSGARVSELLGENLKLGEQVVDPEAEIAHDPGQRILARLEEIHAPEFVVENVRRRVRPFKPRPGGKRTHELTGEEIARRRREAPAELYSLKSKTAAAIERAGLSRNELHEKAGIGRETLRRALYSKGGKKTAAKVADVLADELGLTDDERAAIYEELANLSA